MLYTIQNECLRVTVNDIGAQLWSICTEDGTEVLWQGDARYWADRALTIFPYVARLWQGSYELDGQTYSLPIHGFAPESLFVLAGKTDTTLTFELTDSEATIAQYPRRFALRMIYALQGDTLAVTHEVENRDRQPMYFGLGGHPGFNVPLEAGKAFADYRLRFGEKCEPVRVGFSPDCFVNGEDAPFELEAGRILPLAHELFDDDAIVLANMARSVTLEAPGGAHSVTVSYPDMPYLGIWHWPQTDAPYVCIEPWTSLPARQGCRTVFEQQEDLICLAAGGTYRNRWTVQIR